MVVYDTGSDWLTVKSYITEIGSHKRIDEEKTVQMINDQQKDKKGPPLPELDPDDPNSKGDGITVPFSSQTREMVANRPTPKPLMTNDVVYTANKSMTGHRQRNIAFPLSYGSADLEGFRYKDTLCLTPIKFNSTY